MKKIVKNVVWLLMLLAASATFYILWKGAEGGTALYREMCLQGRVYALFRSL